jgi:hypothetical protein
VTVPGLLAWVVGSDALTLIAYDRWIVSGKSGPKRRYRHCAQLFAERQGLFTAIEQDTLHKGSPRYGGKTFKAAEVA